MVKAISQSEINNRNYFQTKDGTVYEKPSFDTVAGSVAAGFGAVAVSSTPFVLGNIKFNKAFKQQIKKMENYDETNSFSLTKALENMYKDIDGKGPLKNVEFYTYSEYEHPVMRMQARISLAKGKSLSYKLDNWLINLNDRVYSQFMRKRGIDTSIYSEELINAAHEYCRKHKFLSSDFSFIGIEQKLKDMIGLFAKKPSEKNMEIALEKAEKRAFKNLSAWISIDEYYKTKNACYNGKDIMVNMQNGFKYVMPHEAGHAINAHSKDITGLISHACKINRIKIPIPKTKLGIGLSGLVLLTALFRRKKAEGEESQTFLGKTFDFIKNNCVGIMAALQLPRLLEEANASIRGINLMKNYVSKKELGMFKNLYRKAFGTYLTKAALPIFAVFAANSIKNLIDKPKKVDIEV